MKESFTHRKDKRIMIMWFCTRRSCVTLLDKGDWAGIGLFLVSDPFAEGSVLLQDQYPKLLIGTWDAGEQVVQYVDEGRILFAVDQVPYLQGYLAVRLLAWYAHTKQSLFTKLFESGPLFIYEAPSSEIQTCKGSSLMFVQNLSFGSSASVWTGISWHASRTVFAFYWLDGEKSRGADCSRFAANLSHHYLYWYHNSCHHYHPPQFG